MMISRSQYTVDTNVLIDLYRGNVLNSFFELPYQFFSPDVIIDELQEPDGSSLMRLGLQSGELSGERVLEVESFYKHHQNIALNDLFALVFASSNGLTLLTGDDRLRKLAVKHNVRVHGILWALDEMIENNTLKPVEASRALQNMLNKGSRLPMAQCLERFRLWAGK